MIIYRAGRITNLTPGQRRRFLPDELCTTRSDKIPALPSISLRWIPISEQDQPQVRKEAFPNSPLCLQVKHAQSTDPSKHVSKSGFDRERSTLCYENKTLVLGSVM